MTINANQIAAAKALVTATGIVDVSAAAAPGVGQGLVGTNPTHATWQTPAAPATPIHAAIFQFGSISNPSFNTGYQTILTLNFTLTRLQPIILNVYGQVGFGSAGVHAFFKTILNGSPSVLGLDPGCSVTLDSGGTCQIGFSGIYFPGSPLVVGSNNVVLQGKLSAGTGFCNAQAVACAVSPL